MNDDSWEVFDKYTAEKKRTDIPSVTILQKGNLSLNVRAVHVLGNPAFVALAYDRTRKVIRIRGMPEHTEQSTPLRKVDGRSSQISAIAFMRYFDIPIGKMQRYKAEVRDGMLYITLYEPAWM